jgi:tRNA (guanine-N7-)-methyltransferase
MSEHPPVRTFKPRRRSLSAARSALFERLAPTYSLDERGPLLDLAGVFGRRAPVVLDIGIGAGDALVEMAVAEPELDVIGCDVHTPGIAAVLAGIEQHSLGNVRVVHGDALIFLDRIPPASLTGVRIFFPDPWPKARHHHRRLVSGAVVARLVELMRPSGWIHVATDNADYAEQIGGVCGAHPQLTGGAIPRPPERSMTRYERKGIEAGRTIVDFWYNRSSA